MMYLLVSLIPTAIGGCAQRLEKKSAGLGKFRRVGINALETLEFRWAVIA
jgi:hypothetical protein